MKDIRKSFIVLIFMGSLWFGEYA